MRSVMWHRRHMICCLKNIRNGIHFNVRIWKEKYTHLQIDTVEDDFSLALRYIFACTSITQWISLSANILQMVLQYVLYRILHIHALEVNYPRSARTMLHKHITDIVRWMCTLHMVRVVHIRKNHISYDDCCLHMRTHLAGYFQFIIMHRTE